MTGITHLPPLRDDLKLLEEQTDEYGDARWLIFDAVQNRYFSISRQALGMLRHWQGGAATHEYLESLRGRGIEADATDLDELILFLARNDLIRSRDTAGADRLVKRALAGKKSAEARLLHNYLFVRIPLLKPDGFLTRTLPMVSWLYHRATVLTVIALGVLGLFLVSRQWDGFVATFRQSLSVAGFIYYGLAFVAIKILHEFAHGYAAKRLGCRVASMGLALIVLFPILYTDTTDTWRIRDRAQRMQVVLAGLKLEIYIACLATFFWAILPDGQWRSAAFYLATTGWLTSALVNLSPLLRFDGYYFFSDWIGVENLQHRGFALGRWQLRRWLFGLDDPCPEQWDRQKRRTVLVYAYATWVYRFFLFLGIALLVYHLAFKVLGIFLFVVEIYWFIARPILREVRVWWGRRADMQPSRPRLAALLVLSLLLLWLAVPLPRQMNLPAVLDVQRQSVFAPESAQVTAVFVQAGASVIAGEPLMQLEAPALSAERERLAIQRRAAEDALADAQMQRGALPLLRDRLADIAEREGALTARLSALMMTAPRDGVIESQSLPKAGEWVRKSQELLQVVETTAPRVRALMTPEQVEKLSDAASARFYAPWPNAQEFAVTPRIEAITPIDVLPFPEMSKASGGSVAVSAAPGQASGQSQQRPPLQSAHYLVDFHLQEGPRAVARRQRGQIITKTKPRSLLADGARRVYAVLLRELQF